MNTNRRSTAIGSLLTTSSVIIFSTFTFVACDQAAIENAALNNLTDQSDNTPPPRSMVQRPRRRPTAQPPSDQPPNANARAAQFPADLRTIDGTDNHLANPTWGSVDEAFIRLASNAYEDGTNAPAGTTRPSPRAISNAVIAQTASVVNEKNASDYLWQWGQFLDHDIDETPIAEPAEAFDILVPGGDMFFDPFNTGTVTIPLDRSAFQLVNGVREQFNVITAYIDASNVYGSEDERAKALRANDGTGRLLTSAGDLLPFNTPGLANAPSNDATLFLAGDIRANEQVALTAMHTLFVREHNRLADSIAAANPTLTGDEIYEFARAIVGAEMQAITFNEFLPLLLGEGALGPYRGYRPEVNPNIANEFATASYRVGHSMLSSTVLRLDADGNEIANGHLSLAESFFNPQLIIDDGIEPLLRGLSAQAAQRVDAFIIDEVRNFLFGPPGSGGFDLASLNIQRGRDHGLATLNQTRIALGLSAYASFDEITGDATVAANLASVYDDVNDIDLWVGGLAEDHVAGAMIGETKYTIIRDQFRRLRDGDRFFYRAYLPESLVRSVDGMTLARIIRANTSIGDELGDDVFTVNASAISMDGAMDAKDIGLLIAEFLSRSAPPAE